MWIFGVGMGPAPFSIDQPRRVQLNTSITCKQSDIGNPTTWVSYALWSPLCLILVKWLRFEETHHIQSCLHFVHYSRAVKRLLTVVDTVFDIVTLLLGRNTSMAFELVIQKIISKVPIKKEFSLITLYEIYKMNGKKSSERIILEIFLLWCSHDTRCHIKSLKVKLKGNKILYDNTTIYSKLLHKNTLQLDFVESPNGQVRDGYGAVCIWHYNSLGYSWPLMSSAALSDFISLCLDHLKYLQGISVGIWTLLLGILQTVLGVKRLS